MTSSHRPTDRHGELPFDPDSSGRRPLHLRPAAGLLVIVGGALGTAARYGLAEAAPARPGHWPVGTFVANIVGAFVLGVLLEGLSRAGADSSWRRRLRLFAGTGFCGGLTTYSTFAVEGDLLVRDHHAGLALAYLLTSVVVGVLAAVVGIAVAAAGHRA